MAPKKLPDQMYLRQRFNYDPATGSLTWLARPREHFATQRAFTVWNIRFAGKEAGTLNRGRKSVKVDESIWFVHRIIWKWQTGEDVPEIDHKNTSGIDNTFHNLRPATRNQQLFNQRGDARSLPKGVYKNRKRWRSQIKAHGKLYCLGTYDTPEEAHMAYREAATRLHGAFANFTKFGQETLP